MSKKPKVSNTLADKDGLGKISYQWARSGRNISKATNATYKLIDADLNHTITVIASYTDGAGNKESVSSKATGTIRGEKKEEYEEEEPEKEKPKPKPKVVPKKKRIVHHSKRKMISQKERIRSGRRSVFFRQPTLWRITHPNGTGNTIV